jgi:hypothetical protein
MSNSSEETQVCNTCNQEKILSLFPKWRLKCKVCKSAENSARLKERYANDPKFIEATKQRAAKWQKENAERSNEYHRRRHDAKVAAGDREYLLKSSEATKRYYRSEKGKATAAAREAQYVASGQDKAWRAARRLKPESRASEVLAGARNRALKANVEFTLTFDDVYPAVKTGTCQVTGLPFCFDRPAPGWKNHPRAPSIDRIDSTKGYIRGNVQVIIWQYNTAKNQWPQHYMDEMIRAIVDTATRSSV